MPAQVVLLKGGQIDSAQGHFAVKGLPHQSGKPPVDCLEYARLLGSRDTGSRSAKPVAATIADLDEHQGLSVAYHQINLPQRAAQLLTDQAAARLSEKFERKRLVVVSQSLTAAS